MKYDLKSIMLRAWITAKAESINAERIEGAKAAAGVKM